MASNWPDRYVNICQSLRLSRHNGSETSYNEDEGNPYIPIHRLLDLLDWLSRDPIRDRLTVGVALQGLAGLQMQEALRLTWDKVDFENETITIDGEVKNRFRIRRIPVPNVVTTVLKRAWATSDKTGLVVQDYSNFQHYSKALRREMRKWNSDFAIKPKDLRNTIQTAAIDGGWYGYYLQRYVGHAPQTIGERHYHGDKGKRMIPLFWEQVITNIEAEISTWKVPENCILLHDHCTVGSGFKKQATQAFP